MLDPSLDAALLREALRLEKAGDAIAAIDAYRDYLTSESALVEAWNSLGNLLFGLGRDQEALAAFAHLSRLRPGLWQPHFNRGMVFLREKDLEAAEVGFRLALALAPERGRETLAGVLRAQGRGDEAEAVLRDGVAETPAALYFAKANRARALGRIEEAVVGFRQALAVGPARSDILNNLGNSLRSLGRSEEALEALGQAAALGADSLAARFNYGCALQAAGRYDQALGELTAALRLSPDHPEILHALGNVQCELGLRSDAVESYKRSLALRPDSAKTLNNLGVALDRLERIEEALAVYRRGVEAYPDYPDMLGGLAQTLLVRGSYQEAVAVLARYLALRPDDLSKLAMMAGARQFLCDWAGLSEIIDKIRHALAQGDCNGVTPFRAMCLGASNPEQFACATSWVKTLKAPPILPPVAPVRRGPIRVGYFSADFRSHPTSFLAVDLFERHDRRRFKLFGYSYGADDRTPIRKRVENSFDHFIDVAALSDREAAQRIRADRVDILVDLNGYTRGARPAVLAQRPAPIQVNYLAYPGSMGADFMDYILVDPFIVPFDQQPFFSERLVQLPDCYQANDSTRAIAEQGPSRADCGLPDDAMVFCSFNSIYKITPEVFAVWMRLLAAVPGSVLWLLDASDAARDNLRRQAKEQGVPPERLVFAPFRVPADHLARHALADLFLDAFPVNAHTTASDALWAGLPIVTLAGSTLASRVAGSLLKAIGLPELVTRSLAEYEALALALARDRPRLAGLRARLAANRLTTPLFDTESFTRHLEWGYERMVELWQAGHPPEGFAIPRRG